jgi:hypothetical protein
MKASMEDRVRLPGLLRIAFWSLGAALLLSLPADVQELLSKPVWVRALAFPGLALLLVAYLLLGVFCTRELVVWRH